MDGWMVCPFEDLQDTSSAPETNLELLFHWCTPPSALKTLISIKLIFFALCEVTCLPQEDPGCTGTPCILQSERPNLNLRNVWQTSQPIRSKTKSVRTFIHACVRHFLHLSIHQLNGPFLHPFIILPPPSRRRGRRCTSPQYTGNRLMCVLHTPLPRFLPISVPVVRRRNSTRINSDKVSSSEEHAVNYGRIKKLTWQLQVIFFPSVRNQLMFFSGLPLPPLSSFHAIERGWCDEGYMGERSRAELEDFLHVELNQRGSRLQGRPPLCLHPGYLTRRNKRACKGMKARTTCVILIRRSGRCSSGQLLIISLYISKQCVLTHTS